ncbi:MAG: ABC transporter substrate-binding protein [Pseudomonas sp.]|nr:ABC transporter substrate-binding protein [Pseudomonas sp.]
MDHPSNPFARGYYGFKIRRLVVISYDERHPQTFLPLRPSQAHLADDQVVYQACIFNDDFAVITEGQTVPPEVDDLCGGSGAVQAVYHSIYGQTLDRGLIHMGDSYTLESAHEVARNLRFETGFYSRAWEISTAHITEASGRYLCELADIATPTGFLFVAFRIPYSPAIGVKLIATPWTDESLMDIEGITADQLRQEHLSKGMPKDLANVLYLAGLADVRILIFDADAPVLDGLPLYDDEA